MQGSETRVGASMKEKVEQEQEQEQEQGQQNTHIQRNSHFDVGAPEMNGLESNALDGCSAHKILRAAGQVACKYPVLIICNLSHHCGNGTNKENRKTKTCVKE